MSTVIDPANLILGTIPGTRRPSPEAVNLMNLLTDDYGIDVSAVPHLKGDECTVFHRGDLPENAPTESPQGKRIIYKKETLKVRCNK